MKQFLLAGIIALGVLSVYLSSTSIDSNTISTSKTPVLQSSLPKSLQEEFRFWKGKHNKRYSNEMIEDFRFRIFVQNWEMVKESNAAQKSYELEINQFSDLTQEEWIRIYLQEAESADGKVEDADEEINATVQPFNWTAQGAVGPVKDQGQCGSCWSFAATGVTEGYWYLNHGKELLSFSEQQLVDCSTQNDGCNGGLAWKALTYIQTNGIVTEAQYPYVSGVLKTETKCTTNSGPYKVGKVLQGNGCPSLKKNIQTQPTGVSVDASNWSHYKSGVFNNCGTSTNHAVLAVGWDQNENWIIKNSWGTSWGEQGYIRLSPGNTCAVCYRLANAAI